MAEPDASVAPAAAENGGADQAGGPDQQGGDQGFDAPFDLNDVAEEYRGDVERYVKQTQGAFTRKTMELAEQRNRVAAQADLEARLGDESTRQEALQELLGRYDLELQVEGDDTEGYDDVPEYGESENELPQWARALVEREQERDAELQRERVERGRTETEQRLESHVRAELDGYRQKAYAKADALPPEVHDALLGFGMVLPARADGMPDMPGAVAMLESIEAAAVQRFIDSRRTTPLPATRNGSSGTEVPNLNNDAERLKRANAVAARHLEGGL
jgi:hypothetical protein